MSGLGALVLSQLCLYNRRPDSSATQPRLGFKPPLCSFQPSRRMRNRSSWTSVPDTTSFSAPGRPPTGVRSSSRSTTASSRSRRTTCRRTTSRSQFHLKAPRLKLRFGELGVGSFRDLTVVLSRSCLKRFLESYGPLRLRMLPALLTYGTARIFNLPSDTAAGI